jgi:hypothetical protein
LPDNNHPIKTAFDLWNDMVKRVYQDTDKQFSGLDEFPEIPGEKKPEPTPRFNPLRRQ